MQTRQLDCISSTNASHTLFKKKKAFVTFKNIQIALPVVISSLYYNMGRASEYSNDVNFISSPISVTRSALR